MCSSKGTVDSLVCKILGQAPKQCKPVLNAPSQLSNHSTLNCVWTVTHTNLLHKNKTVTQEGLSS